MFDVGRSMFDVQVNQSIVSVTIIEDLRRVIHPPVATGITMGFMV